MQKSAPAALRQFQSGKTEVFSRLHFHDPTTSEGKHSTVAACAILRRLLKTAAPLRQERTKTALIKSSTKSDAARQQEFGPRATLIPALGPRMPVFQANPLMWAPRKGISSTGNARGAGL